MEVRASRAASSPIIISGATLSRCSPMSTHTLRHWPEPLLPCFVISAVHMPQTTEQLGRKHLLHEPLKSICLSSLLRHASGVAKGKSASIMGIARCIPSSRARSIRFLSRQALEILEAMPTGWQQGHQRLLLLNQRGTLFL
jgi:hypothetical protein